MIDDSAKVLEAERKRLAPLTFNAKIAEDEGFQSQMVAQVLAEMKLSEESRSEFTEKRKKIMDIYEGRREGKKIHPFENAADIKTGLLFSKLDTQHGILLPTIYNPAMMRWIAEDVGSIINLAKNDKFMRWANRQVNFTGIVDDFLYNLLLEGTFIFKLRWDVQFRHVRRRIPNVQRVVRRFAGAIHELANRVMSADIEPEDYDTKHTFTKFEKGMIDCPPLDDVFFPNISVPGYDENLLPFISHRTRPTALSTMEKEESGLFINTEKLRTILEEQILNTSTGNPTRESQLPELQRNRQDAEGTKPIPATALAGEIELIERYGKVEVPGVGIRECVVHIDARTKTFLGIMPLTTIDQNGDRPWVIAQFIRRKDRMLGKTPAEILSEHEHEVNTIHNQRLDAGTMSIIPPLFYRASSTANPELLHLKPGLCLPLDDVNDAKWMVVPNNVLQSFQEERMILEMADSVTGIGAYQAGQESPVNRSRSTARGTLAVISMGNQRQSTISLRLRQYLQKVQVKHRNMWAQHLPPGIEERVLGLDGERLFPKALSPEDLDGNFSVVIEADPTAGDKQTEMENLLNLYQLSVQNPIIMQNPGGLWELTAEIFRGAGKINVETYLGPKPKNQGIQMGKSVADEISMIQHGRMPVTGQGDNPMQLLQGLMLYAMTKSADDMEPEHKALFKTRVAVLQIESMQQQRQAAQEMIQSQGGTNGSNLGPYGAPQQPGMAAPPGAPQLPGGQAPAGLPPLNPGGQVPGGPAVGSPPPAIGVGGPVA